ncbi:MAG: hypothetical protein LBC51_05510 [Treponema sp.]|jgi:hypothetical protein|nr:hypothetical protein [Treponema sp.]
MERIAVIRAVLEQPDLTEQVLREMTGSSKGSSTGRPSPCRPGGRSPARRGYDPAPGTGSLEA